MATLQIKECAGMAEQNIIIISQVKCILSLAPFLSSFYSLNELIHSFFQNSVVQAILRIELIFFFSFDTALPYDGNQPL